MPRGSHGGEALDLRDVNQKVRDRFWAKTRRQGSHRIWTGATNCDGAFGSVGIGERTYTASRVSYAFTEPIPAGLEVYVACRVRLCVARDHLVLGTREEMNLLRRQHKPQWKRVQKVRCLYLDDATHPELMKTWGGSHIRLIEALANRDYHDPDYDPGLVTRRRNHPEIFRFTPEEVEEIREELLRGTSIYKISRWLNAPATTVWEAISGPSSIARRQDAVAAW